MQRYSILAGRRVIVAVCAIVIALAASPFMTIAYASTWNVSVNFEIVSDYPAGWDGVPGCMDGARSPVAGGTAGTVAVRNGHTETALQNVDHPELWLTLHRHLYQSVTVATGGFEFASSAMGNHNITDVWMVACNGSTLVYSHEWQQTGFDSHVSGFNSSDIAGASDLYLYAMSCYTCSPPETAGLHSASITIDSDVNPFVPGGGGGGDDGPFKPVSSPDLVKISDDHTIVESRPNANVHSVTAGRIMSASKNELNRWIVAVMPDGGTSADQVMTYDNLQAVNGSVGDTITAGCVLGLAAQTFSPDAVDPTSGGITFGADATTLTDWPDYDDGPDTPCDAARYLTENCLNLNPNFADFGKGWNSTFGVTQDAGVMVLSPGSAIYQDITGLDNETPYYVTLYAQAPFVPASTDLQISIGGATNVAMHIAPSQNDQYLKVVSQSLSIGSPDFSPDIYRLTIKYPSAPANVTMPPIRIRFACLATTEAKSAPSSCYFSDPGLLTDSMEHDEEVTYAPPVISTNPTSSRGGVYVVPVEKAVWSHVDISAFQDKAATYKVTVTAHVALGAPLTAPSGRLHIFIRDSDTHESLLDIGSVDLLALYLNADLSKEFTLDIGDHYAGDLVIVNTSDDISSPGWDEFVNGICLSVDGGVWPSYENSDTQNNFFSTDCVQVAPPGAAPSPGDIGTWDTEGLGSWISRLAQWGGAWLQFGWGLMHYLVMCIIVGWLNSIWGAVLGVIAWFGLLGQWLGTTASAVAAWLRDGARFLFNNAFAGIVPILNWLIAWILSLPIVQSALDAVGLAGIWLDGLLSAVEGVIALFGLAIQFVGALLGLVGVAWSAFLAGMAATPVSVLPIPNCGDPSSFLYDACLPFDVFNFFVAQLPFLVIMIDAAVFAKFWLTMRQAWRAAQEAFET